MKRLVKIICLVSVFVMMGVPAAMAVTINAGDYVELTSYNSYNNEGAGYGGEGAGIMTYSVYDSSQAYIGSYSTFCIQDNVDVAPGTMYPVLSLTNIVGPIGYDNGNNPNAPAGDGPLKGAVAYLFYLYAIGDFDSYFNATGTNAQYNQANQADFQNLLWYLQGEGTLGTYSTSSMWYTDYENDVELTNTYQTEVINIASSNGSGAIDIQNQLYNTDPVPEPSTFLMVSAGLLGIGLLRRFKNILV